MVDASIFNSDISEILNNWLTTKTLGGFSQKSSFQYYDKHLWKPIRNTLKSIAEHTDKSIEELELLSCCYSGELFRVHNYNKRARAHIFPLECYQSWCTEDGLEALSGLGGQVLLIRGHASLEDFAIKTLDLMLYLKPEIFELLLSGHHELCRYVSEHEVSMPIRKSNVDGVYVVEASHLTEWRNFSKPVEQEKWFRNNW